MSFSIVAEGTPEDVATVKESDTGKYLRDLLARRPAASGRLRAAESEAATKKSGGKKQAAQ